MHLIKPGGGLKKKALWLSFHIGGDFTRIYVIFLRNQLDFSAFEPLAGKSTILSILAALKQYEYLDLFYLERSFQVCHGVRGLL